jgi:hypothetical protein
MRVGGQIHAPAALTPGKETRYPLYRRLGGPQGRSERLRKISPPPGFDPRTVLPVASRYAIPAHYCTDTLLNKNTNRRLVTSEIYVESRPAFLSLSKQISRQMYLPGTGIE